jgi:hypothetical protein
MLKFNFIYTHKNVNYHPINASPVIYDILQIMLYAHIYVLIHCMCTILNTDQYFTTSWSNLDIHTWWWHFKNVKTCSKNVYSLHGREDYYIYVIIFTHTFLISQLCWRLYKLNNYDTQRDAIHQSRYLHSQISIRGKSPGKFLPTFPFDVITRSSHPCTCRAT